jgi:hypothetical protein
MLSMERIRTSLNIYIWRYHLTRGWIALRYSFVGDAYEKIENMTRRLEMTDYLVEFLKKTPKDVIDSVARWLVPKFVGSSGALLC